MPRAKKKDVTCDYYAIHLYGRENGKADANWDDRIDYLELSSSFPENFGDASHVDNQTDDGIRYRTLLMEAGNLVRLDSYKHDGDFLYLYFVKLKTIEAMQAADNAPGTEPAQLPERKYIADGCTVVINKKDNIAVIQKNKAIGLKTIQEYLAYFTRDTAGVYHFQEIPESVEEFQNSLASRGDVIGIRRVNISGNLNTIDPAIERKHETVLDAIERVADYFGGYKFEMVIKKADKNAPDLTQDAIFDLISDITHGASDLETASIIYKDEEQPRQSPLDLINNRKKMKFEFELDENKLIRHDALVRAILEQYQGS